MRIGVIPENPLEFIATKTGLVPTPLLEGLVGFVLARTLQIATKVGIFDAIDKAGSTAEEVAAKVNTDKRATERLLSSLEGAGYVRQTQGRFFLKSVARKWLSSDNPSSVKDYLLAVEALEWRWVTQYENYVRTGQPVRIHEEMSSADWELYQRGMRNIAKITATELVKRAPMPPGARDMLDIGGAHGYASVLFCRKYEELRSTILDLPQAVEAAAPILAQEKMGDRVRHWAADALQADLGENTYDAVLASNIIHHFDPDQSRALFRRVARALRPGGILWVSDDVMRKSANARRPGASALFDLYFAVTSGASTLTFEEVQSWQREAGLLPMAPIRLWTAGGSGIQAAKKSA